MKNFYTTPSNPSQKNIQKYKENTIFVRTRENYLQQFLLATNPIWTNRTRTPNYIKAHRIGHAPQLLTNYTKLPLYGWGISGDKQNIPPIKPNQKNTFKEITKEERFHLGNLLSWQTTEKDLLVGFLNTHFLPISIKGAKKFYLSHIMNNKKFDHIELADTMIHWP